jgi:hypothetical protein
MHDTFLMQCHLMNRPLYRDRVPTEKLASVCCKCRFSRNYRCGGRAINSGRLRIFGSHQRSGHVTTCGHSVVPTALPQACEWPLPPPVKNQTFQNICGASRRKARGGNSRYVRTHKVIVPIPVKISFSV